MIRFTGGSIVRPDADLLRDEVEHPRVDPHRRLGRVRRLREDVDHLARGQRVRVGEVEGLPVEAVDVGDVVHRLGDEVDRDDVDLAALDPDAGEPLREGVARPLQELEEVVGPVDLVHLAGLGVADDDPGPVHAPGHLRLLPDDRLGLVLGLEVGVVLDLLGLLEHVLGEGALVEARRGDRADHVEALRVELLGELHRLPGSLDVRDALALGVGGHVVDRRQVEEVVDLAPQLLDLVLAAELLLGEVADHRDDPVLRSAPAAPELLEPPARPLAHQHVDRALPLEQLLDQVASDEAGRPGDEVAHLIPSPPFTLQRNLHRRAAPAAGGSPDGARRNNQSVGLFYDPASTPDPERDDTPARGRRAGRAPARRAGGLARDAIPRLSRTAMCRSRSPGPSGSPTRSPVPSARRPRPTREFIREQGWPAVDLIARIG